MAQRDAYLLFRTLCKLSRRVGEFVVADQERQRVVNIRSKLVALELILVILQNAGPGVQHNVLFVSAIKKHLIISMCSNALVNSTQIYELTLKIFLVLLTRYAAGLKYEIEVCINEIFLKILTSKNSTIEQKTLLLDYLVRICAVPQTLMDIFLNYDCDPVSLESNLFERLVNEMSKLAQIKLTIVNPEVGVSPELYELKMKVHIACRWRITELTVFFRVSSALPPFCSRSLRGVSVLATLERRRRRAKARRKRTRCKTTRPSLRRTSR